jgi:hypothetical protein
MVRLADDFFRLAHHDVSGRARLQVGACSLGLAAALLAELTFAHRLVVRDGRVEVRPGDIPTDPLSHAVLAQIATEVEREPAYAAVAVRLQSLSCDAYEQVGQRLVQAGCVRREASASRLLWGRRSVAWVPTDWNAAAWPLARLTTQLRRGAALDEMDGFLAGLASATGLTPVLADLPHDADAYVRQRTAALHPSLRELLIHTRAVLGNGVLAYQR